MTRTLSSSHTYCIQSNQSKTTPVNNTSNLSFVDANAHIIVTAIDGMSNVWLISLGKASQLSCPCQISTGAVNNMLNNQKRNKLLKLDTLPSWPVISSRKSTSGCTTTISPHHIIQLSNEPKIQRQNQAGNHSSKAVSYNTSESANQRGVLSGLLWRSRMLRPRSITVIMHRTLCSICLSVCAIPSKEHAIYCQKWAFIRLIDLRSKLDSNLNSTTKRVTLCSYSQYNWLNQQ
jgi:hypothetical protein